MREERQQKILAINEELVQVGIRLGNPTGSIVADDLAKILMRGSGDVGQQRAAAVFILQSQQILLRVPRQVLQTALVEALAQAVEFEEGERARSN